MWHTMDTVSKGVFFARTSAKSEVCGEQSYISYLVFFNVSADLHFHVNSILLLFLER